MKIRTKLVLIYLIGALLTSLTTGFAIRSYRSIESDFSVVMNDPVKKLEALKKIEQSVFRIIASTSEFGLIVAEKKEDSYQRIKKEEDNGEESAEDDEEKELMTAGYKSYYDSFKQYENLVKDDFNNGEDFLEEIRNGGNQVIVLSSQLIKLKQEGVSGRKVLEKKEELEEAEHAIATAIERSLQHQYQELAEKQTNVQETISESTRNTLIISAFAFLLAIIGGFIFSHSITTPLNKLQEASNRIGDGNLDVEINLRSNDEIGKLAQDFKKMTGQLRDSRNEIIANKEFVENIIGSMADMLLIVDDKGIIRQVNEATLNLLGYQENEIVGKPIGIVTKTEEFLTDSEFKFLSEVKKFVEVEKDFVCKNGRRFKGLISASIMQGNRMNAVIVGKDISKLKENERKLRDYATKLQQSNRELQDFAYVASHDLQEPLRKVQAFGDRLDKKYSQQMPEEGRGYIYRMRDAANRMQRLINDLLTFSRITTKAQPFEPVDIKKITEEVISDLEVRIEETKGKVEIGDLPQIDADPVQIRQLMQNLIGNALKFHQPNQTPNIKVYSENYLNNSASFSFNGQTVQTAGSGDKFCQIIVQDNGIGFNEKYLDRIFTVFQRLHGRAEYEGSGIGLAVCRKIVERHRGTITAISKEGEGSTFMITLPVAQTQEETINNETRL